MVTMTLLPTVTFLLGYVAGWLVTVLIFWPVYGRWRYGKR